ncbi:MAG TPA: GNAT family N-acetyltransferase [Candidatus Solibacter sp.]|nr:GNAT family N-acetyltransferase [Candidatus Solibacter sp.]
MSADTFLIRDATIDDVPALAQLHVTTFIETHGGPGPTVAVRESQWREKLAAPKADEFCIVIARPEDELVGFARGVPHDGGVPGFAGELNKIYILRKYHRLGLGRRLLSEVSRRFLANGVTSMLLFGEARNPSNGFYEHMGAERLYSAKGEFHGGYGWRDLRALADRRATAEPR